MRASFKKRNNGRLRVLKPFHDALHPAKMPQAQPFAWEKPHSTEARLGTAIVKRLSSS
jgi:hypothetical protein